MNGETELKGKVGTEAPIWSEWEKRSVGNKETVAQVLSVLPVIYYQLHSPGCLKNFVREETKTEGGAWEKNILRVSIFSKSIS